MPQASLSSFQVGCALDFETSGYDPWLACSLGLARIEAGKIVKSYYTLLKPPSSQVLFTDVHGLTWEDLQAAPTFLEVWPTIAVFLEGIDFFVAHNAPFDLKIYYATLKFFNLTPIVAPFLCTLKGARKLLSKLTSKSLASVCRYFSINLNK